MLFALLLLKSPIMRDFLSAVTHGNVMVSLAVCVITKPLCMGNVMSTATINSSSRDGRLKVTCLLLAMFTCACVLLSIRDACRRLFCDAMDCC